MGIEDQSPAMSFGHSAQTGSVQSVVGHFDIVEAHGAGPAVAFADENEPPSGWNDLYATIKANPWL